MACSHILAMTIEQFIEDFENAVEDVEPGTLGAETIFKSIEQWDSLSVLTVIAMLDAEYDIRLKARELKEAETLRDLFSIVKKRKLS